MTTLKSFAFLHIASLALLTCNCSSAWAQWSKLSPTHKDIAYGNIDPAQKLDVYLAKSDVPTAAMIHIHGGGWNAGSKNSLPEWLVDAVSKKWLSVISVEYRFTSVAPHPAQVNDCLSAIQFVRQHASEWNIDPKRMGVTGGSAGGHLSLWVALHDDIAQPASPDPVSRQSSRVACAVSFAGPTDWSLLSKLDHKHPAYRQLLGYQPGTPAESMDTKAMNDVSPIIYVSQDDPPIMQIHGDNDDVVPIDHARLMDERLKEKGVPTELVIIAGGNHSVAGASPQVSVKASEFVHQLLVPEP